MFVFIGTTWRLRLFVVHAQDFRFTKRTIDSPPQESVALGRWSSDPLLGRKSFLSRAERKPFLVSVQLAVPKPIFAGTEPSVTVVEGNLLYYLFLDILRLFVSWRKI